MPISCHFRDSKALLSQVVVSSAVATCQSLAVLTLLFDLQVVITDLKNRKWKYYFPCGQWLAADEGDGQTSRDLLGSLDPLGVRKGDEPFVCI